MVLVFKKYFNMNSDFKKELENLINKYSQENGSDTPDFLLAEYLIGCLTVFNSVVTAREVWFGRKSLDVIVQPNPLKINL
jgi:hypothetical protein